MERRGKKLLAGSGFPGDQYREITQLAHADKITERRQQRFAVPNYAVRTCQLSNPAFFVGLLMQRHADAPVDRAHNLAARGRRIENAPGCHRADHARNPNDANLLIDS